MKGGRELLLLADLALPLFQNFVVELDHAAASGADEVVVVRVSGDPLVVIVVLAEMDAPDGRIRYLRPVAQLSETPAYWSRPPVPLGYHRPEWPPRG